MNAKAFFIASILIAIASPALAINKCKGPDGKTVFQDKPCADGGGEQLVVRPASGKSTVAQDSASTSQGGQAAAGSSKSSTEIMREQTAELQRKNRLRDLEIFVPNARIAIRNHRSKCDSDIAAVRSQQSRAANNLAGATWLQSMATEMEAISSRCDTEQRRLDGDLQRLLDVKTRLVINPFMEQLRLLCVPILQGLNG